MIDRPLTLPSPLIDDGLACSHPTGLHRCIEAIREEERERIARDIHDVLGSQLVAVKIEAALLAAELADDSPQLKRRLQAITGMLDEALEAASRFSRELRPGILRDFGLGAAIECQADDFSRRTGLACRLLCIDHDVDLPDDAAVALFRAFQEALTNVYKHARATTVEVRLARLGNDLLLEVQDDGRGLAAEDLGKRRSCGLRGMRARLADVGGRLEVSARHPRGTRLWLILPLAPARSGAGVPGEATAP